MLMHWAGCRNCPNLRHPQETKQWWDKASPIFTRYRCTNILNIMPSFGLCTSKDRGVTGEIWRRAAKMIKEPQVSPATTSSALWDSGHEKKSSILWHRSQLHSFTSCWMFAIFTYVCLISLSVMGKSALTVLKKINEYAWHIRGGSTGALEVEEWSVWRG